MRTKIIAIFMLTLLLGTACGPEETPQAENTAGSRAWIDAPLPGSSLPLAAIDIVAHAASPDGIASFEINLNGQLLAVTGPDPGSIDQTLMYTRHAWQPAAPGSYLIEVKAFDRKNQPGPPAQVMVVIGPRETIPPSMTPTSNPTVTSTITQTPTEQGTPTITPTITSTALPCDLASFGGDITVPDGTDFAPGETFRKTWRINNIGSCVWTTAYSIVYISGDQMDASDSLNLGKDVNPGESIDISIPMRAPEQSGNYKGYWKLSNPQGQVFGFENGAAFYVEIEVLEAATPTTAPLQGCTVRIPSMAGTGIVCKYPCPPGANPGLPCTP